jgi:alpha-methylacyl-CoA racemase
MLDGAALLMAPFAGLLASGDFNLERGTNLVDSGAPFYDVYQCSDGEYVSVGALEPQFFSLLTEKADLDPNQINDFRQRDNWTIGKEYFAGIFRTKTRAEWCQLLEGTDCCFAPVLSLDEAPQHPHNHQRGVFQEFHGVMQPSPAPRFSRTPGSIQRPAPILGANCREVLREWLARTDEQIDALLNSGVIGSSEPV